MSLLLASAVAATLVAAADVDLNSPTIFVSGDARAQVADGTVKRLICLDLPERSKFRSACLTSAEWNEAVRRTEFAERRRKVGGRGDGLLPQPLPSQLYPSYRSWGLRPTGR